MLEAIRKRIHEIQQQVKKNRFFSECIYYLKISIFIGIFFKYAYNPVISFIWPVLDILHISSVSSGDHSYLFSTCATIVSTVFTIIFVLLTVFVQVAGPGVSIDILWSRETKYLIRLYFSTIVLSLMMLEAMFQFPIIILTLTLACIFILYPFLRYYIGDKLMYDVGPTKLDAEICSNILINNEPPARTGIMSLSRICENSIKDDREDVFNLILSSYEEITIKANENKMVEIINLVGNRYSHFLELLINDKPTKSNRKYMVHMLEVKINSYVSKYSNVVDSETFYTLLVWGPLNTITERIKAGFNDDYLNERTIIQCYKSYSKLKEWSIDDDNTYEWIIESLGELAKESYNYKLDRSLVKSIGALFTIGVKAYKREDEPEHPIFLVVDTLNEIKEYISPGYFEKIYSDFNDVSHISRAFGEKELEPFFDEFKKFYNI
jgi:hypothetical protein